MSNRSRDFCVTPSRTHVSLWLFDCSERQRKQLLFKGLPCLGGHGVLGFECSNHSVPTLWISLIFRAGTISDQITSAWSVWWFLVIYRNSWQHG